MSNEPVTHGTGEVEFLCNACVGKRRSAGRRFIQIEPLLEHDHRGDKITDRETGQTIQLSGDCGSCGKHVTPINQVEMRHKDGDSRNRDNR